MDNEESLRETFGDEFTDSLKERIEDHNSEDEVEDELDDDEHLKLLIASMHNHTDKAILDGTTVLSKIDAEKHPEVFEAFEDSRENLQEILMFLESEHVKDIQHRDYEI